MVADTRLQASSHDDGLEARVASVRSGIADAARAAGRSPDELTLVVVTKYHPASLVRELAALGVTDVGENRHQEAQAKAAELADLGLTWHFVGQLQSKKARQARRYAHVVQSLDRGSVVDAFAPTEAEPEPPVIDGFVQVNLTDDPGRGGVQPDDVEAMVARVLATGTIRLRGVMAVAPLDSEPRAAFARLRSISERVVSLEPGATDISAGMSGDYAEAILEGATHLRIGTAITGNRPPAP
ncbi:YggS family pyridoxal phosphate-dependent enzyme [Curtobacterium flaccumfaciens]|uniref:YggS family pyridoxal phosphate-dependent enzyme n=1 Tax=Curtobacterium flaccumfaciens TaxID=2035 RepID=UPI000FFF666C|nr:YggS family pyridoxal phosphate-dependent enzyme [Curtobacterium flaccumfaciens]MCS0646577.1 YggS family pyridoxal phosphate-dependent enzyme [Curtobacterium flaccumfaciens pv. flaccumfaciens]MCS6526048.1 YggS family pyridoxal phosphate-dependent enzyme [Curtobacterium flaccumfaciens pv. flaccumfaciens]MCS6528597.1 YggS family pyridoxal phosphate-dependent enzyme [Curtobacterium flaccumfaciens pv. flaccumfaciens]NUU11492.1 YggS family pyridoxal phosphate-dependent enzyme [Curtobacterium flac